MLVIKNGNPFSISVVSNTNRLVSSSSDNFGGVRPGTYIKLGENDNLYPIFKTNNFFYLKDFTLIDNKTLKIPCDTEINLQPQDTIKIIYDEYELNSVLNIINGGKFYSPDDIINISGGEVSIDIREGFGHPTKLQVKEVDENGCIKKISLFNKGKYITPPSGIIETTSKTGMDAQFELNYSIIDNRAIINRVIKTIRFENNETILELDYSLPSGIKNGKLSVEKWEIFLNSIYLNPTSYNLSYKIFKDFSPNYSFPLIAKNSNCLELLLNEVILKSDSKIKELENRIKELEK